MKKLLCVLLLAAMVFSLCACKSEAATQADELIAAIGEVSLSSEAAIIAAEQAVASLTEKEVNSLDGLTVLQEARATYNGLVAEKITSAINSIGTVSQESVGAIAAAREAYDNASEDVKNLVSNYNVLVEAEAALADILYSSVMQCAKITVANAYEIVRGYTGSDERLLGLIKDLEDMIACSGTFYQNGKYKTTLDFFLEYGEYNFDIDYGGYTGIIGTNDIQYDGRDGYLFRAESIGMHINPFTGNYMFPDFFLRFSPDYLYITWGSSQYTLERQ